MLKPRILSGLQHMHAFCNIQFPSWVVAALLMRSHSFSTLLGQAYHHSMYSDTCITWVDMAFPLNDAPGDLLYLRANTLYQLRSEEKVIWTLTYVDTDHKDNWQHTYTSFFKFNTCSHSRITRWTVFTNYWPNWDIHMMYINLWYGAARYWIMNEWLVF